MLPPIISSPPVAPPSPAMPCSPAMFSSIMPPLPASAMLPGSNTSASFDASFLSSQPNNTMAAILSKSIDVFFIEPCFPTYILVLKLKIRTPTNTIESQKVVVFSA